MGRGAAPAAGDFLIVGATFSAIPFTLLAFATLSLPASLASLLMATTPLFTALVSAAWLRQRVTKGVAVGLGVGFGAVVFLLGGSPIELGPATILAFVAGLGAAFSYAVAGTFVRRRLGDVAPLDLATGQLVAAAVILLPLALVTGHPGRPLPRRRGLDRGDGRRLDGDRLAGLLPRCSADLGDGRQQLDVRRPDVRDPVGRADPRRADRCRAARRLRAW